MQAEPVRLAAPLYEDEEIQAVLDVMKSKNVTQGERVFRLEREFCRYIEAPDTHGAAMVNSGSSANLLCAALWAHMAEKYDDSRREVIMPALTWSTTVAPFIQHGFKPVFVDVGADYCMDPGEAENAINENTFGIVPVHLLGNPCDMTAFSRMRREYRIHLMEDCCEALNAKWRGQNVGTFGGAATYSFYLSHHITTVEGGMLVYPKDHHEVLGLREHGWIRLYPEDAQDAIKRRYSDLHPTWLFNTLGYNLRSTELSAAMGLVQLGRQNLWQLHRMQIADYFDNAIKHKHLLPRYKNPNATSNPFSYPVQVSYDAPFERDALILHLKQRGIETRPVMTGNITRHPYYATHPNKFRVSGQLDHTDAIHRNSFLIPCGPHVAIEDAKRITAAINEFLVEKTGEGFT